MNYFRSCARLRLLLIFLFTFFAAAAAAHEPVNVAPVAPPAPGLVISQVYGGGGNTGAMYKNDFIEIYNPGSEPVSVAGWSVQYASSTGSTWQVTALSGAVSPGRYYLVQEAAGTGGTVSLPTPHVSGNIAMSASAGKVALVNTTTALTGSCPVSGSIVDLVGYGTANCSETAPTPGLGSTSAAIRKDGGSTDTNNNFNDFTVGAPQPRNDSEHAPTGVGAANPPSVSAGGSTVLTVTVTPGVLPASTGIAVIGDLSTIGGSAKQPFYDDGSNGDAVAGDNIFTLIAAVPTTVTEGAKSLAVTVSDAELRSSTTTIALNVTPLVTSPSGIGASNPSAVEPGGTTLLTVAVTPGTGPLSTGIAVTADLTMIGGAAAQAFFDNGTNGDVTAGDNTFSFAATVGATTTGGTKPLAVGIADAQGRTGTASITLTVVTAPAPGLVISQVYGGGGNSGATYKNDFIEIFNLGSTPVSVAGWSVQYGSATGSSWQVTPLSGTINPGRFYLVQEAQGAGGTVNLPTPDAVGNIPMAAGSGKVALVNTTTALAGACPTSITIADLVGFGTTNCAETSPTPVLSNTTAAIRKGDGSVDTNNNLNDFTVGAPRPSNSSGRPPTGVGAANPASLSAGESAALMVTVTPGAFPASTGIIVSGNLTEIGGSATQPFYDDGTNGDAIAGDSVFTFVAAVPVTATIGSKSLSITVADAELRFSTATISLIVEPAIVPIHEIQGAGLASPLAKQLVATRGIVTGSKYNGFFIQAPDAEADTDPNTSEGIFVYTGATTTLAKGTLVKVAGTVSEFVPSGEPASLSTTEIGGTPSVTAIATGQQLPSAYTLTAADISPYSFTALERLEGMLVHVDALRVIAPTGSYSSDEVNATTLSDGVFYGVIDGMMRPFREPGIPLLDPLPSGSPCCVPRFDDNPERLRVDSGRAPAGSPIDVAAGALVSNLTGPMEFAYRTWTILPDPLAPPTVPDPMSAVPVPEPGANEFTVGSYNMERFFDDVDDPAIGDPVLTPEAFAGRQNKASLAIRNVMRMPDIVGVEEVENLSTLQTLALKINADAVAAGQPDPAYAAYLEEGNDVGGIDVGFLVKKARVSQITVTQAGRDATYIDPTTNKSTMLNDRPPLVLQAAVQGPIGSPFPVTVIVNHLRSLNGIDDETPDGLATTGARVRAKRAAQAEFLATLIQDIQTADPATRIVSVGDYNALAVNDGYVDLIGTIKGQPTPGDQVVVASPELVSPALTNLVDLLPVEQAYSYSFDGSTQALDHILANASMMKRFNGFHYARNNADFPEVYRNDANRPERLSDHDMPVAYFAFPGAPTLTLNGANPMYVECCTAFSDPGATASDEDLGDLTSSITVSGTVDANAVGTYTLTYSVSNGFVTTTKTRTVYVVDTIPPLVTLNGSGAVTIELGGFYEEKGASASDTCAGSLAVQIVGAVNTSKVGTYPVVYSATDGYNATSVTRTVTVVDTTAPKIASITATPDNIWPANKHLVPVVLTVNASDLGGAPSCRITEVTSDEHKKGHGGKNDNPDWIITGDLTVSLRAEKKGDGRGDERTYTMTVVCRDASGNSSTGAVSVDVAKEHKPKK